MSSGSESSAGDQREPYRYLDCVTNEPESSDQTGAVRELLAAANRRLLGDTITVPDADWRQPTALPGWTRAHVASHLARHAEAFTRLANWAHTGVQQQMYPGDRDAEIAAGAGRTGLEIQTDLDTTAEALDEEFAKLDTTDGWSSIVTMRGGVEVPARVLPVGRLFEVLIHHVDLGLGFGIDDIDVVSAETALRYGAVRVSRRDDYPALIMITASGSEIPIGRPDHEQQPIVRGPANLLLGWLTRRSGTDGLNGDVIELPTFG
jgi:maleylpyruvate isomerase